MDLMCEFSFRSREIGLKLCQLRKEIWGHNGNGPDKTMTPPEMQELRKVMDRFRPTENHGVYVLKMMDISMIFSLLCSSPKIIYFIYHLVSPNYLISMQRTIRSTQFLMALFTFKYAIYSTSWAIRSMIKSIKPNWKPSDTYRIW